MTSAVPFRRLALWLALSASMLTAVVPAAGLVLCVHHDAAIEFTVGENAGCPCDHGNEHPDEPPPPCDDLTVGGLDGTTPIQESNPEDTALLAFLDVAALTVVGPAAEPDPDPVSLGPPRRDPPCMRRLLDARRAIVLLI